MWDPEDTEFLFKREILNINHILDIKKHCALINALIYTRSFRKVLFKDLFVLAPRHVI